MSAIVLGGLVAACGTAVPPSEAVVDRPRTVEVSIRVEKAGDPMLRAFAHEYVAEARYGSGDPYRWRLREPGGAELVPEGAARIEAWSVVYGDTVECAPDPVTARESCFSPVIGEGERCAVDVVLEPSAPVALLFRLLPNERCRLRLDKRRP